MPKNVIYWLLLLFAFLCILFFIPRCFQPCPGSSESQQKSSWKHDTTGTSTAISSSKTARTENNNSQKQPETQEDKIEGTLLPVPMASISITRLASIAAEPENQTSQRLLCSGKALPAGKTINLLIDSKIIATTASQDENWTAIVPAAMDFNSGSHILFAQLVDDDGIIIATSDKQKLQLTHPSASAAVLKSSQATPDQNSEPHNPPAVTGTPASERDSDHDGVNDNRDLCDNTPAGTRVDELGCDTGSAIILKGVNFETNSSNLTAQAQIILNKIADTLKNRGALALEIAGHTDSDGSAEENMNLSQMRALMVLSYLKEHGVDTSQFIARGYGETRPIADNKTAAGKALNRRVELRHR